MKNKLDRGLILSCQPSGGDEYFYDLELIKRYSLAAEYGGAIAVRIEGVEAVRQVKEMNVLPIIGLIKRNRINSLLKRNITTQISDVEQLFVAGADIVAIDFTLRENGNPKYYKDLVKSIRNKFVELEILADISTFEEAIMAEKSGVNYISTTLAGYTHTTRNNDLPDVKLLNALTHSIKIPVVAEGGYWEKKHFEMARDTGCHLIVIGTALTRPHEMLKTFNSIWSER